MQIMYFSDNNRKCALHIMRKKTISTISLNVCDVIVYCNFARIRSVEKNSVVTSTHMRIDGDCVELRGRASNLHV